MYTRTARLLALFVVLSVAVAAPQRAVAQFFSAGYGDWPGYSSYYAGYTPGWSGYRSYYTGYSTYTGYSPYTTSYSPYSSAYAVSSVSTGGCCGSGLTSAAMCCGSACGSSCGSACWSGCGCNPCSCCGSCAGGGCPGGNCGMSSDTILQPESEAAPSSGDTSSSGSSSGSSPPPTPAGDSFLPRQPITPRTYSDEPSEPGSILPGGPAGGFQMPLRGDTPSAQDSEAWRPIRSRNADSRTNDDETDLLPLPLDTTIAHHVTIERSRLYYEARYESPLVTRLRVRPADINEWQPVETRVAAR